MRINQCILSDLIIYMRCARYAAFQGIIKEVFDSQECSLRDLDLSKVFEPDDVTDLQAEAACAGGACTITQTDKNHILLQKCALIFSEKGERCFHLKH